MALLSTDEKTRIEGAVASAEAKTGGEIVTAIIGESSDYAYQELLFGLAVGVLSFIILALTASDMSLLVDRLFWYDSKALLPLALVAISLAVGTLFYALAQIPALDRFIVGRRTMAEAVRHRALRHFVESAVYDTVDRTGVLLFVSVLERRVELIADKGINTLVPPDSWDRIVSSLLRGLREKRSAEAMVQAIEDIGNVLAEHVPRREDDQNELNDAVSELERNL